MDPHVVAQKINTDIEIALNNFGSYQYQDKGPNEIMDVRSHVAWLDQLCTDELIQALQLVIIMRMAEPPDRTAGTVNRWFTSWAQDMIDYFADERPDWQKIVSDPLLSQYR